MREGECTSFARPRSVLSLFCVSSGVAQFTYHSADVVSHIRVVKPDPHDHDQVDQLLSTASKQTMPPRMDVEVGLVLYKFLDFEESAPNLTTRGIEAVGVASILASGASRRASCVDNSACYNTVPLIYKLQCGNRSCHRAVASYACRRLYLLQPLFRSVLSTRGSLRQPGVQK